MATLLTQKHGCDHASQASISNRLTETLNADYSTPQIWARRRWESGWAHSIARSWVTISSLLAHMVYLSLFFWSYLVIFSFELSNTISARPPVQPSDPDTMTTTSRSYIASSSSKIHHSTDNQQRPLIGGAKRNATPLNLKIAACH